MTYCLGMRVEEGLIGIADTRITTGSEVIEARKVSIHTHRGHQFFIMTSGLRSVRDKTLTYFDELLEDEGTETGDDGLYFDRLYKAVNCFSDQLRRVSKEDGDALANSKLNLNMFALIGGRFEKDPAPKLYLLYPQGNWIDIGPGTPYQIIGATRYGKPILDRTLNYTDTLRHALKVGCLSFDSTRISTSDVDFPIDVVIYRTDTGQISGARYEKRDLAELSDFWQQRLREALQQVPGAWEERAFGGTPEWFDWT